MAVLPPGSAMGLVRSRASLFGFGGLRHDLRPFGTVERFRKLPQHVGHSNNARRVHRASKLFEGSPLRLSHRTEHASSAVGRHDQVRTLVPRIVLRPHQSRFDQIVNQDLNMLARHGPLTRQLRHALRPVIDETFQDPRMPAETPEFRCRSVTL